MTYRSRINFCFLAFITMATSVSSANLLSNGGFEGAGVDDWVNWGGTSSHMNIFNNNGAPHNPPGIFGNFTGVTAYEGEQFVAGTQFGIISQDLSTSLVSGQQYEVSVRMHQSTRSDLDHPSTYSVMLSSGRSFFSDLVAVGVFAPTNSVSEGWVSRTLTFVAPTGTESLRGFHLAGTNAPGFSNSYAALDDVRLVEAVPEPATMLALAAGIAGWGRRRKTSR